MKVQEKKPVVRITDLEFGYSHAPVLSGITVHIHEKEIVTIMGPNGGGKTTLLKLILGLLKPSSGNITVFDKAAGSRFNKIGYVPQYARYDTKFPITVSEVVLSGRMKNFGYYSKSDKEMVIQALDEVGLVDLHDKSFSTLSGGQMQRILIARALVTDCQLLLLDEPTSNIDPEAGKSLNTLLKKLNEYMTIVLVTHDTGFVQDITDRILCVNKQLVEHPADKNFARIVESSYGSQSLLVRHDHKIHKDCCSE